MQIKKITDEMHRLVDEMQKAISDAYTERLCADERKLEAVLKENGWCKASELITEIANYCWEWIGIEDRLINELEDAEFAKGIRHAYMQMIDYLTMIKNQYARGEI